MTSIPYYNELLPEDEFNIALEELTSSYKYAYNGPCEVMQRQLIILNAFRNYKLDYRILAHLDFFIQHGKDIGLPYSLHYPHTNRIHGLNVRLGMIDSVHKLFWASGIITSSAESLFDFQINPKITIAEKDFKSGYLDALHASAEYLEELYRPNPNLFIDHMYDQVRSLREDPNVNNPPLPITALKDQYTLDYHRMEGLKESIPFQKKLFNENFILRDEWNKSLLPTEEQFDLSLTKTEEELKRVSLHFHDLSDLLNGMSEEEIAAL